MTNIWIPRDNLIKPFDDPFGGLPAPVFFAPFGDTGNGIASVVPSISYGLVTFFSRATAGWTRLSSGLWTSIAANQPRSYYGCTPGTVFAGRYDGLLLERTSQNNCLWSRDWTNAVWVKTNMSVVKDATGIDGVANSASRLFANANNATVVQNPGVNDQAVGVFIRRISGVGTIEVQSSAGFWTNVTAEVAVYGAEWSPIAISRNSFGATGIGIRLGTAGDEIAVDMGQCEDKFSGTTTTPIPTQGAVDIRLSDSLSYGAFAFNPLQLSFGLTVSPAYAYDAGAPNDVDYPMSTGTDINNYSTIRTNFFNNSAGFDLARSGVVTSQFANNPLDVHGMNPANIVVSLNPNLPRAQNVAWNENTRSTVAAYVGAAKVGTNLDFFRNPTTGIIGRDTLPIKNVRVYNVGLDVAQISALQQGQY